ncbi:MAG: hypothetical protein OXI87_10730 [Albidovulum sp.]|nr:hypothetical protein [Albidovulum sp.]
MDQSIESLKSTTFFGKRPARQTIAQIQETIDLLPEAALTICEHPNWRMRGGPRKRASQRSGRTHICLISPYGTV